MIQFFQIPLLTLSFPASLDLCWLQISPDNLNKPNKKIGVTAVGLNVRSSLGLIWFVLKCFPACVRGLKASGSLNTSPTCQDQLHTFIWCHCALPSQTGKTKTDRDSIVFYLHEWQQDYSISSLCHSLLCQYFGRGYFVLFFCYISGFNHIISFVIVRLSAVYKVELTSRISTTKTHRCGCFSIGRI